jgi:hypothetical protein
VRRWLDLLRTSRDSVLAFLSLPINIHQNDGNEVKP